MAVECEKRKCVSVLWLCALCSMTSGITEAQEASSENAVVNSSPVEDRALPMTFEELRADGARRSKYLGRPLHASDAQIENPRRNPDVFEREIKPILQQACVSCHGPDAEEGNVRIDTLDPDLLHGQDVNWWLEILAVLTNGEMPPADADKLPDNDRAALVDWLSNEIHTASTVRRATGGHSSFRRMTRYEYRYAMQDLLGLSFDFAKDLPPEARSDDGFQNSSELLHMSVTQLETYRQLARRALQRATVRGERPHVIHWGIAMKEAADREWPKHAKQLEQVKEQLKDDPEKQQQELERLAADFRKPHGRPYYRELSSGNTVRAEWRYNGAAYAFQPVEFDPQFSESFDHVAVIPSGRNQHLTIELGDTIPDEGMLRVRVRASRTLNDATHIPSLQLEFGFQASNEGRAEVRVSDRDTPIDATSDAPQIYQWDVPLGEIYPRNSFRGVSKMGDLPSPSEFIRFVNSSDPQGGHGEIQIDYVEVTAPVYDQWPPESHRQIFFDSPHRDNETVYAREVLTRFLSRAWRRSLSDADIEQKLRLFHAMRAECDGFEDAMTEVLASVLSSPDFLYVVQREVAGTTQLSAHELATRLSIFLWCSVPDQPLLQLAAGNELHDAAVLTGQVKRMLADPRSQRFAEHFVHQWLDMQLLDFLAVQKTSDPELKEAMQQEPIAFFQEILRNDESVLNFIHSDYMMANERLARHCGLSDVFGNHFRRVPIDSVPQRGGLLTQSGLLAMNSDGTDSHPLKRGVWLLKSLLNDPPPPPPPAVPQIDLADPKIAQMTLKQRIEDHRNHAACLSCHAKIDPWGIAFENYDALGRWRDQVNGQPVDSASLLFNHQKLDGMDGLKRFLLQNRQDQFVRAMVHKLTTYALGRPLTFSDHAAVDNLTADVRRNGDGLATMIRLIVTSDLFQSK
ncbi:MAG: DUF1592 domain-containing protein [Planctomycetaceae bacterium]